MTKEMGRQETDELTVASRDALTFVHFGVSKANDRQQRQIVRSRAAATSHRDPQRKANGYKFAQRQTSCSASDSGHSDLLQPDSAQMVARKDSRITRRKRDPRSSRINDARSSPSQSLVTWEHHLLAYSINVHFPPGVQLLERSAEEGYAFIDWHMRQVMAEPCLWYMQLLTGCTPLVAAGRLSHDVAVWIRAQLISAMNDAICDSVRALSTPTIIAVGSIAMHEHLFGDQALAVGVHGRAFLRMLAMRGGLENLHVPRIGTELLKYVANVLSERADRTASDLVTAWAPEEHRVRFPRYDD